MKKLVLALVALFTMTVQASAMSYEQARDQALFLTDKMAYELNLTDDQYEAAYEINLDYLMGINNYNDLYGAYWTQRNLDLSYILLDWQYRAFVDAAYFYRPLYWDGGYWHFRIYARYPHRDYFFFGRPTFYVSYHGGHSWRMNGGRSWYHGRTWGGPRPDGPRGDRRMGMRDGFDRGDFGRGSRLDNAASGNQIQNRSFGNGSRTTGDRSFGTRTFGANRQSSTRTTVTRPGANGTRSFGQGNTVTTPRRTFTPNGSSRSFGQSNSGTRSFGQSNGNGSSRSFGQSRQTAPSTRSMGNSTPTRTFSAPSRSSGSFGGGNIGGGGGTRSFGGGHSSGTSTGGGHFGRR